MANTVKLTIVCSDLPDANWDGHAEIWLGVQRGKVVEQAVRLPIATATFVAELRAEGDATPNFLGPFAQGGVGERFVYLCWGRHEGPQWVGFRRAKLPISHLTWADIESGEVTVELRCTDAKGGPICAMIKGESANWPVSPT